jgi:adenosine kinase
VQYVLPPNSVVYVGCVGDDDLAEQLREANQKESVASAYQVKAGEKTGACAVVITGHHRYAELSKISRLCSSEDRSLVTTLRAAEQFEKAHLSSPEILPLVEAAKFYYVGGFFLTHGVESAMEIAQKAANASKV